MLNWIRNLDMRKVAALLGSLTVIEALISHGDITLAGLSPATADIIKTWCGNFVIINQGLLVGHVTTALPWPKPAAPTPAMPKISPMAALALAISVALLCAAASARAADLPNKAAPAVPYSSGPCVQTYCVGIYIGANIVNEGANFDVLGSGLNGLASNGITLGGELGVEYWNGKIFAALEGDLDGSVTQNGPGLGLSNSISERILGKLGYSLSSAFGGGATGSTPSPTIPAAIVQALMTPYLIIGTEHQPWGWGLSTGAGVQALIATNWTISADYIHTDFNNASLNANVREQTDNAFVLHLDFHGFGL